MNKYYSHFLSTLAKLTFQPKFLSFNHIVQSAKWSIRFWIKKTHWQTTASLKVSSKWTIFSWNRNFLNTKLNSSHALYTYVIPNTNVYRKYLVWLYLLSCILKIANHVGNLEQMNNAFFSYSRKKETIEWEWENYITETAVHSDMPDNMIDYFLV